MDNWVAAWQRKQASDSIHEWKAHAEKLQMQLALAEAQKAGGLAQALALRNALRSVCPNHPLLQPSAQVYRSGTDAGQPKTNLALVYERGFDQAAARMSLASPVSQWRED